MKKFTLLLIVIVLLSGCASPAAIVAPEPTSQPGPPSTTVPTVTPTAVPTDTQIPTATAVPTLAPTDTLAPTASPQEFVEAVKILLGALEANVSDINMVRMRDGVLEVEVKVPWASKDKQPNNAYALVQMLSSFVVDWDGPVQKIRDMVGKDGFSLKLTTYSALGDYVYQSLTDFATLRKVQDQAISFDEWIAASGAAFK